MQQNLIFALHGFLGESTDWSKLSQELETILKNKTTWVVPSLFSEASPPIVSLSEVPAQLVSFYKKELETSQSKIFIGYSLGARIGMHFLQNYADFFDHFIFVSAHPGLQSEQEKQQRRLADKDWSDLISEPTWNQFLTSWNSQKVFSSSTQDLQRERSHFDLQKLKASLELWSLGQQSDMRHLLTKYQEKITWVVGSEDGKFLNLASGLKQKKILLDFNRIFSGHRILFKNPKSLATLVAKILS